MMIAIKSQTAASAKLGMAMVVVASSLACQKAGSPDGIEPKVMADALHAVMESDRTIYTRTVVNRLTKEKEVIKASEHWKDEDALPLPAQMFRMGAEMVAKKDVGVTYSLLSMWPINKQNKARTDAEKEGLAFVANNREQNFYTEEELGGVKYFTAIYADTAVAPACVSCHNDHKDSPRDDFKLGDVMGGVVLRIPLQS